MGKSAAGAVWLNEDKLSAFDFWQLPQYRGCRCWSISRLFTELSEADIKQLEACWLDINGKDALQMPTTLCHGKVAADAA